MNERVIPNKLVRIRYERTGALLGQLTVLPTSMHVPMRILQLHKSPNSDIKHFAEAISADASLAVKVLSLANSSWFSPRKPVVKVRDAISMIGLNNLLPLLFGVSMAGLFNRADLPASERLTFWRTGLFKAVLARHWATLSAPEHGDEAFVCALLQDIAVPVMTAADRSASVELVNVLELEPAEVRAAREVALFGADHCEFGAELAKRIGLPQLFVEAIRWHHTPPFDLPAPWSAESAPIAPALWLAASVPHGMTKPDSGVARRIERAYQVVSKRPDVRAPEFAEFLHLTLEQFATATAVMGDTGDANAAFKEFVQEVCEQVAHSLCGALGESARTIGDLQTAKQDLEGKVMTLSDRAREAARDADHDPLTGAFNRRGFMVAAQKTLDDAAARHVQCAIGFVDVDDFKGVNDRFGHDTGDEALIHVSAALKLSVARLGGVVGRMGGDEFAFILAPRSENGGADTQSRQSVRSEIVASLAGLTVKADGGADVTISCSIGLFWIGTPAPGAKVELLLAKADRLMYDAKRAGKGKLTDAAVEPARPAA